MFIHPTGRLASPLLMLRHAVVLALVVGSVSLVTQQQSHTYVSSEAGCLALNIYHETRNAFSCPRGPTVLGQQLAAG